MKKVLITGASGFVGNHLIRQLLGKKDYEIHGTYLVDKSLKTLAQFKNQVKLTKIDLNNEGEVLSLIKEIKPELVFHLAASASPADSFSKPKETLINNISSEINLLEAIREISLKETRILIVSSADVYGKVDKKNLPLTENAPLNPSSPYAVSKVTQDYLGLQYNLAYKLKTVRVRPFNHIGPGQSSNFVVSAFARKIAQIEKKQIEPVLKVGNLTAKRDFTDARDMVKAYELIIQKGVEGDVYNIGSGISCKISDILNMLLSFSSAKIRVEEDKSLLRPIDNPDLVCNATKLEKVINWKPEIQIGKTLKDVLDYWRENI